MINTIKAFFSLLSTWFESIRLRAAKSLYKLSTQHDRKSVMHWPFPKRRYHKVMSWVYAKAGNILY